MASMPCIGVWKIFLVLMLATVASAQEKFRVRFDVDDVDGGSSGNFTVEVRPEWAPMGAERFADLVEKHFFDNTRFYRVITGFVAEFGISGDPEVTSAWSKKTLPDDVENDVGNHRGTLSFITDGKDDRSTRISINVKDNDYLDGKGYVPFAEVVEGMFVVDRLFSRYGRDFSSAPDRNRIEKEGNNYLDKDFPQLSKIHAAKIIDMPDLRLPYSSAPSLTSCVSSWLSSWKSHIMGA